MGQRTWRGVLVAAILAGLPETAMAAPGPGEEPWLRVVTPNFTLYGEIPELRLVAIANRLEAFRAALERLHPGSRASPRETSIFCAASRCGRSSGPSVASTSASSSRRSS